MADVWMTNVPSDTQRTVVWTGSNYQEMMELVQWGFPGAKVTFDLKDHRVLIGSAGANFDFRLIDVGDTFTVAKPESPQAPPPS